MDREKNLAATVPGITRVGHELATKPPPPPELVNNAVYISTIQQSDSVIHIYTSLFIFFFIMVYHRVL
ncbi:hypothetical protein, partial [Klebsiella pneumoniae]|uniref:hypothetical protein n=1 Tax=Klebsiella pneumoniae TaxID=573 RepID=UPI00273161D2